MGRGGLDFEISKYFNFSSMFRLFIVALMVGTSAGAPPALEADGEDLVINARGSFLYIALLLLLLVFS